MTSAVYIGIVERGEHGFGVFFPDAPGCVSAGASQAEAMLNGEQALAAHIEFLAELGEDIPEPQAEVQVDEDIDVAAHFLARVELPGKAIRVQITMPEALVARIDRVAKNRSAFLAEAARDKLARELAHS